MTITTLLLVLVAATPSGGAADVTLLNFTAQGCGFCQQMKPTLERLAASGMPIKAIDLDKSPKWAEHYSVQSVPTFIVIDSHGKELDRTAGAQPAADLERFFRNAQAKASRNAPILANRGPAPNRGPHDADRGGDTPADSADDPDGGEADWSESDEAAPTPRYQNPKAWETVVRIRVLGQGSVGFGSGTIISSTPEESLILTCAHVFKLEGRRQQPHASQFPRKIMIDLFDGNLRGTKPAHVAFAETVEGKAVDYDFTLDVGLIRIKPGRRLPSARVVPAHWTPKERMHMLTVGCSEGQDASVWATKILRPKMKGLAGNPSYEAIECAIAPRQGRSGGGLFTDDGYVAGVCNFAETHGQIGLYATPTSIYRILDRNKLMALYAPVSGGNTRLVADSGADRPLRAGSRRRGLDEDSRAIARGQSPDRDDERLVDNDEDNNVVMIPSPEMLKIKVPDARNGRISRSSPVAVSDSSAHGARWQLRSNRAPSRPRAEQTAAKIDSSVKGDPFESFSADEDLDGGPSESRKPLSNTGDQLNWRPVK
jgi:thiol-disulfide isomerase/thioredoxin